MVLALALASMLAPAAGAQAQSDPRAEASALAHIVVDTRAKLRTRAPLVSRGLERLERFSERCPALARAATRAPERDVEALSTALTARFFYEPLLGTLDGFAGELEAAAVTDRVLRSGVAGWRKTVEILQTLVRLPPRLCAAVRRWARSGYARRHAPVEAAALAAAERSSERVSDVIARASRRLRKLGASAMAAEAFTVDGMLVAAFPDEVEEEGSSEVARVW